MSTLHLIFQTQGQQDQIETDKKHSMDTELYRKKIPFSLLFHVSCSERLKYKLIILKIFGKVCYACVVFSLILKVPEQKEVTCNISYIHKKYSNMEKWFFR